jgi:hypothetical protein
MTLFILTLCHYDEWHCADGRNLFIMLNVIVLSVIMLSVVAPFSPDIFWSEISWWEIF